MSKNIDKYKLDYFVGDSDQSIWTSVYQYSPQKEEFLNKRGEVFAVIKLEAPAGFNATTAGNLLVDHLHESFFESQKESVTWAFVSAIKSVQDRLKQLLANEEKARETGVDLDISAVIIRGNEVYFVNTGSNNIFMLQPESQNSLINISENLRDPYRKEEVMVGSSYLIPDQRILICTDQLYAEIGKKEILQILQEYDLTETKKVDFEANSKVAALMFSNKLYNSDSDNISKHFTSKAPNHLSDIYTDNSLGTNNDIVAGSETNNNSDSFSDRLIENVNEIKEMRETSGVELEGNGSNSPVSDSSTSHSQASQSPTSQPAMSQTQDVIDNRPPIEILKEYFEKLKVVILRGYQAVKVRYKRFRGQEVDVVERNVLGNSVSGFNSVDRLEKDEDKNKSTELPLQDIFKDGDRAVSGNAENLTRVGKIYELIKVNLGNFKDWFLYDILKVNHGRWAILLEKMRSRNALYLYVVILAIIVSFVSIRNTTLNNQKKDQINDAEVVLTAIEVRIDKLESHPSLSTQSVVDVDTRLGLLDQLVEIEGDFTDELNVLPENDVNEQRNRLAQIENKILGVVKTETSTFLDVANIYQGEISDVTIWGNNLYVSDSLNGNIYRQPMVGGNSEISGSGLSSPQTLAPDSNGNLIVSSTTGGNLISIVNPIDKTVSPVTGVSIDTLAGVKESTIYTVTNSLYVTTSTTQDLHQMNRVGQSYSFPNIRYSGQVVGEFSDVEIIDKRLVLLSNSQGLVRIDVPNSRVLAFPDIEASLNTATAMTFDDEHLFIVDNVSDRLMTFDFADSSQLSVPFVSQFILSDIEEEIVEIVTSKDTNSIYIATKSQIYTINKSDLL